MRMRSYFLTVFVGVLVAAAVWSWPAGPLWQVQKGAGRISGFSPDGRVLVTSYSSYGDPLHITRWDATTGKVLSRAEMACDRKRDDFDMRIVWPSADGTLALVGQGVGPKGHPEMLQFATGDVFLHDGTTGKRILGPIEGANHIAGETFSKDGRWIAAYQGDPQSGVWNNERLAIYSTENGKRIVDLPPEIGRNRFCCFAPDGTSAAVQSFPQKERADNQSIVVRIIELPSGRQLRHVELPPKSEAGVQLWDGRYLTTILGTVQRDSRKNKFRRIVYDLDQDPLGDGVVDPLCRDFVDESGNQVRWAMISGPEWAAFFTNIWPGESRQGIAGWLDGLAVRFGWARDMTNEYRADVWMVDRTTGKTRYALPRPVPLSLRFSEDGKLVACGHDFIEVWDTDPPWRWPKVLAWGMMAAGTLLFFRKWRNRAPKAASPDQSQNTGNQGFSS